MHRVTAQGFHVVCTTREDQHSLTPALASRFLALSWARGAEASARGDALVGKPSLAALVRHYTRRVGHMPEQAAHDDALCEAFAAKELFEATREAREAGERCVCFFDNLSGQTTEEHLRLCRRAHCDR